MYVCMYEILNPKHSLEVPAVVLDEPLRHLEHVGHAGARQPRAVSLRVHGAWGDEKVYKYVYSMCQEGGVWGEEGRKEGGVWGWEKGSWNGQSRDLKNTRV
jgi:hypothetical protein